MSERARERTARNRARRRYRNVWAFYHLLVHGGYPPSETTMQLAKRSIDRNVPASNPTQGEEG